MKLAGEVADGVIISGPRRYIEKATALVREGLERRRERPPNTFDIVVWVPTILIRHGEDLNLARETVALVAADAPKQIIEMAEIDREKVQAVHEAVFKFGVKEAARLVTEDLLKDFSLYGDEEQICQSFRSLAKYGVNKVVFGPPYGRDWRNAAIDVVGAWRNQT